MSSTPTWLASGQGGTPLVMLHGLGFTAEAWLPQLNHFGRSRASLAWTQPGFAGSPGLAALSWKALADALAAMLDELGIDQAHIMGHSLGGMVAQELYHHHPRRVASLILYSTSSAFGSSDPKWKEDFVNERKQALSKFGDFSQASPALLDEFIGPRITPALRQLAICSSRDISAESYLKTLELLVTFNRKADLAGIEAPTLLLAGEHDPLSPPKGVKRMAEQIRHAQYHEIAGVQHMASLEAPAEFNTAVERFLSAL